MHLLGRQLGYLTLVGYSRSSVSADLSSEATSLSRYVLGGICYTRERDVVEDDVGGDKTQKCGNQNGQRCPLHVV